MQMGNRKPGKEGRINDTSENSRKGIGNMHLEGKVLNAFLFLPKLFKENVHEQVDYDGTLSQGSRCKVHGRQER